MALRRVLYYVRSMLERTTHRDAERSDVRIEAIEAATVKMAGCSHRPDARPQIQPRDLQTGSWAIDRSWGLTRVVSGAVSLDARLGADRPAWPGHLHPSSVRESVAWCIFRKRGSW
jgi:hypothetical protein